MKKVLYLTIIILSSVIFMNNLNAETIINYGSAEQWFFWGQTGCLGSNCTYYSNYTDKGFSSVNSQYYYFDYSNEISSPPQVHYYGAKMVGLRVLNTTLQSNTWYKVVINLTTDSSAGEWLPFDYSTISRYFGIALLQSNTWNYNLISDRSISGSNNSIVGLFKPNVSSNGFVFEIGSPGANSLDTTMQVFQCYGRDRVAYPVGGCGVKISSIEITMLDDNNVALQNIANINQQTNTTINNINSSITSEDGPELTGLSGSAGWLPPGPVDSILNLPLSLMQNLTINLSKSCSPVVLTLPYVDRQISLPCINTIYTQLGINGWLTVIGTIASAFILYRYLLSLYKWVDDTLTFRENTWCDWGGV